MFISSITILVKSVIESVVVAYQEERPLPNKVRAHGLGMLQIYLPNDGRIHVWDRSLMVPGVSQIHSHAWGFRSTVVAGTIRQKRYFTHSGAKAELDLPTQYNQAIITPGPKPEPRNVEAVWVVPGDPEVYNRGQYYGQPNRALHASGPEDGTVTLVERQRGSGPDHAFVLWPVHDQFVSAAPRKPTVEEAIRILTRALERIDE